ncbi:carbohydrate ABC transporter permease [Actinotalea fermentans]|uniref:carbohydrate ABC transporter permease n=1 Tax=Actinotalea fermentans TaxID=43671 RepID=UPI0016499BFE|nr:sugar ABC transporter permease [Actinotalea fermentans]
MSVALLVPAAAVIVLLMGVPLATVVADSFTDRSFLRPVAEFVGLENYSELLGDPAFWQTLGRSLLWTGASVVLQIALGLAFAMLLNQRFRGRGLLRGLFLLPWVTPVVVVALIWKWMLNDLYGVINGLLGTVNPAWGDLAWFSDQSLALGTVIGVNVWRGVPFTMIILLAGLQSVPKELVEAASVDGAGRLRTFLNVTLPHLRGILLTVAMIFTMFNFNNFDLVYLGTRGGPADRTMILPVKTYDVAFNGLQVGEAGAWAVLTLITIALIAGIYFAYMRRAERKY